MQPTTPPPSSSTALRRYGPIAAIVVVIAVIAVVVIANRGKSDNNTATGTTSTTAPGGFHPAGVVSWSDAEAAGTTKSIDWGSRCDTSRGTLAYPSYFAGQCFKPFKGDNGGATSQGVTATSVKVVLYQAESDDPILKYIEGSIADTDTNAQTVETIRDWINFYQTYYETYGRKIDLVPFTATGNVADEVAARADATQIAESIKPFAVIGGPALTAAFGNQLASDHILCLDCMPGQPNNFYPAHSPYVYGLTMNPDEGQVHNSEFIGKELNGKKAVYAGEADFRDRTRKFGEIYISTGQDSETQQKHFEASLAKYGVHLDQVLAYQDPTKLQTDAPGLIAKLKAAGDTSVLFVGDPVAPGPITKAATGQDYFPEWIITGSALTDTTIFARTYDQKQWSHAFGVSFLAARTDPSVSGGLYLYQWFYGHKPPAKTGAAVVAPEFNLLFAVLQGVGPDLTPQTFQDALFAGPPTKSAVTQPQISFGNHGIWPQTDYLGIDDATLIWWNPTAKGPDEINGQGTGMYEYVDGGKRYLPGHWPSTLPKMFDTSNSVTIYTTVPPGEQVPSYPSPAKGG
ncbi:MAG TPA: ABC transporter substrate-binding protein [Acidimicrobiales bacterium]|nr:ABC transporter substrate-binding protein [Acidimicrobiales bacterium]